MIKRILIFLLFFPLFISVTALIHEAGHAITGKVLGVGNPNVYFWPGYEIYPNFGKSLPSTSWPKKSLAFVIFNPQNEFQTDSQKKTVNGIVGFMGSGLTYIVSVVCLLLLWYFKPAGVMHWFLFLGALLFYDILFYSVFPTFFDLPHLVVFGGNIAEPILALEKLGLAQWTTIPLVLLSCALQVYVLTGISSARSFQVSGT